MPRNVILAASFPAAADRLFDMYLDPQVHADFTGAPVVIEPSPGARSLGDNILQSLIVLFLSRRGVAIQNRKRIERSPGRERYQQACKQSTIMLDVFTKNVKISDIMSEISYGPIFN